MTKHTAVAAHRPRRAPDRLGPLEIAIAVLVLVAALSLVLVSRSVASGTTAATRPAAVSVSSRPGPVGGRFALDGVRTEPTGRGGVV